MMLSVIVIQSQQLKRKLVHASFRISGKAMRLPGYNRKSLLHTARLGIYYLLGCRIAEKD